ncbi:MAG: InlB B-repeat-containing protein [Dehalococcoidales bacterium]|nr:InlB B-repeat-containing protein [Dehalococcoidales bacterium]
MDVSSDAGGIVEVNDTALSSYPAISTFESNSYVYLEAIPASGYRFENWSGDLPGTDNPTTIMMDCSKKITASFSRTMNTLTMRVDGNGSTTPAAGNNSYEEGTVISITATPESGWRFNGWTGDVAEPDIAITTVTIDSDKTVTANFSRTLNTLTMRVDGNGSTTPAAGNNSYEEGTVISITATPESGWRFNGWMGDVAEPDIAITTVTIDSNKAVTASFSRVIFTWWLTGGIAGGVAIIGVVFWLAIRNRAS